MSIGRRIAASVAALLGFAVFAVGSYTVIFEGLGYAGSGTVRLSAAIAILGGLFGWWLVAPKPPLTGRSAAGAAQVRRG